MVKVQDILEAMNRRLLEEWPERTVYVDVCPVDFDRPSFWLAVERSESKRASRWLVQRDVDVRLTIFDEKDDHYEASWSRLMSDADRCAGLFCGVLEAAGRTLTLAATSAPREPDRAHVVISTQWMEPLEAGQEREAAAEHYHLSVTTDGKKIYETELSK